MLTSELQMSRDRKGGERTDSGWHAFEPNNLAALAVLAAELIGLEGHSNPWQVTAAVGLPVLCNGYQRLRHFGLTVILGGSCRSSITSSDCMPAQPLRPDDDWLCIHRDEADDISFDKDGYDKHGYDRNGYDKDGYDK